MEPQGISELLGGASEEGLKGAGRDRAKERNGIGRGRGSGRLGRNIGDKTDLVLGNVPWVDCGAGGNK